MTTKNDIAWETYIKNADIKLNGQSYVVVAENLKAVGKEEPRLLAKIDNPKHLPKILRDASYSLLANTNGTYLIFKGNIFATIPICEHNEVFQPKTDFALKTAGRSKGESDYIDNAFNIGLISEFTKISNLYLTIRGRERTRGFNFRINESNLEIQVEGVQIEVDAGYEGENDIVLIEGKIGNRGQFNIRQLYYPFRHFSQLVPQKNIRTLFFAYDLSKATYTMHEFGFKDTYIFDSIYPIQCSVYSLLQPSIYIINDLTDDKFETQNNIAPQADDLNKVLELLTVIKNGQKTVSEIADYFAFDQRQSNYYGEAAEFLGFITRSRGVFELTKRGYEFISTEPKHQQLFAAKLVVNSWFFKELIKKAKRKGYFTVSDIEELITKIEKNGGSKRYTESTIGRRIKTAVSWAKWLSEQFKCFEIDKERFILQ